MGGSQLQGHSLSAAMSKGLKLFISLCLAGFVVLKFWPSISFAVEDWAGANQMVNKVQGDLEYISTDDLFGAFQNSPESGMIIIDARAPEEFAVSHLRSAINAENVEKISSIMALPESHGKTIVVYCSVGYRSAILGNRLKKAGFKVFNLKGSIFKWANEGKPVFSGSQETHEVHPYNKSWGKLLDRKYWPGNFN